MFTLYSGAGRVLLTTDCEALARTFVLRGRKVTRTCFGETAEITFGLTAHDHPTERN